MDPVCKEKIDNILKFSLKYTRPTFSVMTKIGYCSNCGQCCFGQDFFVVPPEFIENKPIEFVQKVQQDEDKTIFIKKNHRGYCRYYKDNKCMLYSNNMPEICKTFPVSNTVMLNTCTYMFITLEELQYFKQELSKLKS